MTRNSPMFRFTIRELVLVTVIAALALGWYADRHALWYKWAIADDRLTLIRNYLARRGVSVNYMGPHAVEIGPRSNALLLAKQFHESEEAWKAEQNRQKAWQQAWQQLGPGILLIGNKSLKL